MSPNESSSEASAVIDRRSNWLHRFAWFTSLATLLLICSGGMVTSKGVGLAVPDWPTTFGYNMFLFPVSKWVGGIFFEHTHRLIASTVGFLTIILALWIWRGDRRRWMRNLGFAALGEELGNRHPHNFLDLCVEVDELASDPRGDLYPDGRLAGAHEADQRDVPV